MTLKKTLVSAMGLAALAIAPLAAEDGDWMVDFEAAKAKAVEENKTLLVDFTGSDWCGWCIRLDKEVFSTEEFKKGVEDKFVLVELDFPKDKSAMSKETLAQNEKLQEEYAVTGFPTILLMDGQGRPFAKTGYQKGGPAPYLESLDKFLETRVKRDELFEEAAGLQGTAKAEANLKALQMLPIAEQLVVKFYGDQIDEIKESGLEEGKAFVNELENAEKFAEFQSELQTLGRAGKNEEALVLVNETLENGGFSGEQKQQIAVIKVIVLTEMKRFDESLKALEEAKAIAPESQVAGRLDGFKTQIETMKNKPSED